MSLALPGRPAYLAFLPEFLFRTDENTARYAVRAWLLMLLPSLAMALVVRLAAPGSGPASVVEMTPFVAGALILVGPLVETLLLAPPLLLMNRLFGPGPAVLICAIFFGALHSVNNWATHGLIAWWPFLIMSIALLTWRGHGLAKAGLVVWLMHGLQNSAAVALLGLLQLMAR